MNKNRVRIIVVGAGYGGMMAALRVKGKTKSEHADVVLVNAAERFVQRLRLHEIATNQVVPDRPIIDMLRRTGVQFVQGWVSAVNPTQHLVRVETLDGVEDMRYDYLVYALGSVVDQDSVPGVREHAYVFNPSGAHSALALREKLLEISNERGQVVVVGGGATGVEGATYIKGLYPDLQVSLVTVGAFAAFKGERVERHIRNAFDSQGIPVYENLKVKAVKSGELALENGDTIAFDVCLWAGGFRPPAIAGDARIAVNDIGQILTDPYMRSISHPDIYAVGDAGLPVEEPGVPIRMSVFAALVGGAHAADNLSALVKGKQQKPLSFEHYGQAIALGPNDTVGFATYPADKAVGPIYRGRVGFAIRAFFVWYLFIALELERRWPGSFIWTGKRRYAKSKRVAQRRATAELTAKSDS